MYHHMASGMVRGSVGSKEFVGSMNWGWQWGWQMQQVLGIDTTAAVRQHMIEVGN